VQQDDDNHGYNGPLHVGYGSSDYKIADDYIQAAKLCGFQSKIDVNDFATVNKSCRWPKWIDPQGKRSDAAHGFVHPIREIQDNLHILVNRKVVRILFDGSKAVGVEYVARYSLQDGLI
jgi:alcohol oxidase